MNSVIYNNHRGFTLIEIIVTLLIVSVLGTMIITYFGKAFLESQAPVTRLRESTALHRIMENIRVDYNVYPKWRSETTYASGANVNVTPTMFNGRYYNCTTGGTSGTTEPDWTKKNSDGKVEDGIVRWTESGRLRVLMPLTTLKTKIGTEGSDPPDNENEYGKNINPDGITYTYTRYNVYKNHFVKFTGGGETDDTGGAENILKVTLKNETGDTLTALFVSD